MRARHRKLDERHRYRRPESVRKRRRVPKHGILDRMRCLSSAPRLRRYSAGPRNPAPLLFAGLIGLMAMTAFVLASLLSNGVDREGNARGLSWPFTSNSRPSKADPMRRDWRHASSEKEPTAREVYEAIQIDE